MNSQSDWPPGCCDVLVTVYSQYGLMSRIFANSLQDPGRVISKTQKWYLMPPCLRFSIIR